MVGPGRPPCVRASVWCLLLTPPTAAAPPGCGRFTRDPTRAITPWAGASSPGPLSAPRQHPSRLSSPAGLLAQLLLWPLPRASIAGASLPPLSLTFVFSFHGKSSLFHFSSLPSLEGPLPASWSGGGQHVLTCPDPLCCLGPSKQAGLRGHSVPNMELGRACDTPGFEGVGWVGCCGQLC